MQIQTDGIRHDFMALINDLNAGKGRFRRWLCAHIHDPALEYVGAKDSISAENRTVLDFYLNDIDGTVFFASPTDIYIVTEALAVTELESIAYDICDLLLDRHSLSSHIRIYALSEQPAPAELCAGGGEGFFREPLLVSSREITDNVIRYKRESFGQGFETYDSLRPRVLLIEDDKTVCRMVKIALRDFCQLITAPNMNKGLSFFLNAEPDVTFLDIGLPDGDGRQALEFMLWNDPGAYIVMFSSDDDPKTIDQTIERGARGFLAKPFARHRMLDHIYAGAHVMA